MTNNDNPQWNEPCHTISATDNRAPTVIVKKPTRKYIIRRLTPTECARLQGFPDFWGQLAPYNPVDAEFWESVRKTYAEINGKTYKPTKNLKGWYDKLHTDSSEYKMWGNGIALPNAEYVLSGISEHGAKTLGSLFDGSGGFPLAGVFNGIEPIWASEVEPYPIAVTKSRFKTSTLGIIRHIGDVSKINGDTITPVDVITFGSPCQDMSVAGKREGMKHSEQGDEETTRSGLFYEAVRIIKEMREATNGEYPKYAVWENVPGAFSSNKGWDFHAVLEAFCAVCDDSVSIPEPYDAKRTKLVWNKAGEIVGDNYSIAWRTLDAQYWGVPQRRKRIYLVADFTGRCAGEILFKPDSLRGDMSQGDEAGQGATADAVGSVNGSVGVDCLNPWDCQSKRIYKPEGVYCTLPAMDGGGANNQAVIYSFDSLSSNSMKSSNPNSGCRAVEVAKCIDTTYPDPSKNQGGVAVVVLNDQGGSSINIESEELSPTLRANSHQHEPVIALQANDIDRADTAGCSGCGCHEDEWREIVEDAARKFLAINGGKCE